MIALTPELLLRAYAAGIFPMAEDAEDRDVFWVDPEQRGVLPLDNFHLPRRLRRIIRHQLFEVRCDSAFREVVRGCAEPRPERPKTWINDEIVRLYSELFELGFAHSVECWHGGALVGGLYGVALGGAFFGESMFSRVSEASKVALVELVARLRKGGFRLLDTQFVTAHLERFGAIEIPRRQYHRELAAALEREAYFPAGALGGEAVLSLLQSSTLIS
ncbi:MAG TPA: leucyl/phenylalanyl-tRNA--protein transferase [Stellaceae bacterium]|nr:leucyl/phenylalanyl-tRNA--protein transferase [Stellaceae bacterium]